MADLKRELERHINASLRLYELETGRRVSRLALTIRGSVSVVVDGGQVEAPAEGGTSGTWT